MAGSDEHLPHDRPQPSVPETFPDDRAFTQHPTTNCRVRFPCTPKANGPGIPSITRVPGPHVRQPHYRLLANKPKHVVLRAELVRGCRCFRPDRVGDPWVRRPTWDRRAPNHRKRGLLTGRSASRPGQTGAGTACPQRGVSSNERSPHRLGAHDRAAPPDSTDNPRLPRYPLRPVDHGPFDDGPEPAGGSGATSAGLRSKFDQDLTAFRRTRADDEISP